MAKGDHGVARRARAAQALAPREAGLASAQFRLALPQMPRAVARGASLHSGGMFLLTLILKILNNGPQYDSNEE